MSAASLPVAIIGAGPVGLAAAAHLLRRGERVVVLEAGPAIAHGIRQWGHVRMFTPWRYCTDAAATALLKAAGWRHPPLDAAPTGAELVAAYLEPLAALRQQAPATRILWIMRKDRIEAAFGGEDLDGLPARGALGSQARALVESGAVTVLSPFRVTEIRARDTQALDVIGDHAGRPASFAADALIVATGFRPDLDMLREIRLSLDPWLECAAGIGPLIDPNLHSCGTVRPHGARELAHAETGFFIAGMKSYGRAPTFLLATGHEQVRSIAAALTGDADAAARVELVLPETGVCSTRPTVRALPAAASSCCAPKAVTVQPAAACCGPRQEVTS